MAMTITASSLRLPSSNLSSPPVNLKGKRGDSFMVLRANCLSESNPDAEPSETGKERTTSSSSASASASVSISSYNWSAGLGGLGFLETSYLTYLKASGSEAFCPVGVGGGACGDILNSDYAMVFGVPLSLIGMISYGFVFVFSLQMAQRSLPFQISESDGRLILLLITTSMATASTYFLYILNTEFAGALSCSYCLASVVLSFSLFLVTLKGFGLQEMQKVLAVPLCTAAIVLAVLGTSYSSVRPALSSSTEIDLPFYTSEIATESSPLALSLARHLHSIGAKMYGAFWCSHCLEQKEIFGREASKLLDYVECFPEGYRKGVKIAKACADAGIDGFPTWVVNGQVLSGEQELAELARISGFDTGRLERS